MSDTRTIEDSAALASEGDASLNRDGLGERAVPIAPPRPRTISRRSVLRELWRDVRTTSTAVATAGAAVGLGALATPAKAARPSVRADVDPGAILKKLVDRTTFGATESELALASSLGYSAYLERALNPAAIDDAACDALLAPLTTIFMTPAQLYLSDADIPSDGTIVNELIDAKAIRAIYSQRQLLERMVDFWTDHFNIAVNEGDRRRLKTADDRDVIRANALGNFRDMLLASARSAAMSDYLDNKSSNATSPNENYARELMELHAMGADGGYTQTDVQQVARCFTGWYYYFSALSNGDLAGTFRFNSSRHAGGSKTVLGNTIPARTGAAGEQDGIDVINILAAHPSTAAFVSKKMCRYLLGENVRQSVIDAVAATYTATSGDIKSMIRTAFDPNTLYDADPAFKRPFHLYASTLRVLPATLTTPAAYNSLRSWNNVAGHQPFFWVPPDGYPNTLGYWGGLLVPRWNFPAQLMNGTTGSISGIVVDDVAFYGSATTADQLVDRINAAIFQGEMLPADRTRVRTYLATNVGSRTVRREAIGLALSSPSFQWY